MQTFTIIIPSKMPSFRELEKEFGKGKVSSIFDGRAWRYHQSCLGIEHKEKEEIVLKQFNPSLCQSYDSFCVRTRDIG